MMALFSGALMRRFLLSRQTLVEFGIALAVVLLVRGAALVALNWTGDDYLMIYDSNAKGLIAANISMLRTSGSLTAFLAHWLGASNPTLGSFWSVLSAASMVSFGLALRHFWLPGSAPFVGIIAALIFALFPGHSNLFSYQMMHPSMIMNYGLASFALIFYARKGWLYALSSVGAIALSLGYQTMLSLFLVAGLLLPLFQLARIDENSGLVGDAAFLRMKTVARFFLVLFAGVFVYICLGKLIIFLTGAVESGRTVLAGSSLLPEKISILIAHIKRMLLGNGEINLPARIKLIQFLLLINACLGWLSASVPCDRPFRLPWQRGLLLFVLLVLAACSILVPAVLLAKTQQNPRNLMATSVFWSGIFCLAWTSRPLWLKRSALILSACIVLSYAVITNTISVDYSRLIQRQHFLAVRMVERLSLLPGFDRLRTVVVVGSSPDLTRDLRIADQVWPSLDANIAAGVMREVSGSPLLPPHPTDQQLALTESRAMAKWPLPGSTAIKGDVGIVVLDRRP